MGPDGEGVEADRRQGLARAADPLGPFAWDPAPLVPDTWSIDGHPFGEWLFYNVRTDVTGHDGRPGSGNVVDRLLALDRPAGDPGPGDVPERAHGRPTAAGQAYWNEGAWVMARRGRLHQMYSGGFYREATYGIGTAWADDPRGPWTKDPANPIFRSGSRITGPGITASRWRPTAHPVRRLPRLRRGAPGRKVHLDRLFWCGDRPAIGAGRPTEGPQPAPPGPVYDPAVPHWHAELWASGGVAIAGAGIELGPHLRHVCARQGPAGLRILVDGAERASRPGRHAPPAGAIVTSHLDDDGLHALPHAWAWGGAGPSRSPPRSAARGASATRASAARTAATRCCAPSCRARTNCGRGRRPGHRSFRRHRTAQPLSPERDNAFDDVALRDDEEDQHRHAGHQGPRP